MRQEQRFKVVKAKIQITTGGYEERWLITESKIPVYRINEWLDLKSIRKIKTGKEYASKLVVFLNFLAESKIEYKNACRDDVLRFLMRMIYGEHDSLSITGETSRLSFSTLSKYLTVITGFYKWLDKSYTSKMTFETKKVYAKHSYLYGQIYKNDYKTIVDRCILRLNSPKEYIKWYTDDETKAIGSNFLTLRDKAIFLTTLAGFRIDEVLSMRLADYDSAKRLISPSRSKGKPDSYPGSFKQRSVYLPIETCDILNRYILTERMSAETEGNKLCESIFINLKQGANQGDALKYRTYWEIFKKCAKRAGLDESKIRTHSGRSTKVMQCLEQQALHPEDNITDAVIAEILGWKSLKSMENYRDHNNQIVAKSAFDKLHGSEADGNER